MIGKTISHYPAFRDPIRRDKNIEKLGEVDMSSLIKKYNKLIPHAGGVVFTPRDKRVKVR